jgi:predicted AAA+ superfamily ATPase
MIEPGAFLNCDLLFRTRNRVGFLRFFTLLPMQSGGLIDFSSLARESELSRPTVMAHVEAISASHAVFLVPPFAGGGGRQAAFDRVVRPRPTGDSAGVFAGLAV